MQHHHNDRCLKCGGRLGAGHARGRCVACYKKVWRAVQAGVITWAYLEAAGTAKKPIRSLEA